MKASAVGTIPAAIPPAIARRIVSIVSDGAKAQAIPANPANPAANVATHNRP